jgi:hypothetical protein
VRQLDRKHHPRLDPATVPRGAARYLNWCCPKGPDHRWKAVVLSRTQGRGCPFCAGHRVSVTNSLAKCFPAIARELHTTRNGKLRADEITWGTRRKVWWQCQRRPDHVWDAAVVKRTREGQGCPFCIGKRVHSTSSLATTKPFLARQWDPLRNGNLTPHDVTPGSNREVWWNCEGGPDHVWRTSVASRGLSGRGCPFCCGQRASRANSLGALYPSMAKQWFVKRNAKLTPWDVTPRSGTVVWWRCSRGPDHRWQASVANVIRSHESGNTGCPVCRGLRVSVTNSIATLRPDLVREWHAKNVVGPGEVAVGSGRRVWWKCAGGADHEWETAAKTRAVKGHGCPFCSHRFASRAFCLASIAPRLARQWHPTRNGKLTPYDVTPKSRKTVWWQCAAGHAWAAAVNDRHETGCPHCYRRKQKVVTRKVAREVLRLPSDYS